MIDPARAEDQVTQVDAQRIMEMIPHRHPFLMVDKVVDMVANEKATGIKNVSIDEYYFQGHFPDLGCSVLPGRGGLSNRKPIPSFTSLPLGW